MWLRTVLATVALAVVLSCGALIDGAQEFPGPWALVPVGATMLLILAGANLRAAPAAGCRCPIGCWRPGRWWRWARWRTRCTCGTGRC